MWKDPSEKESLATVENGFGQNEDLEENEGRDWGAERCVGVLLLLR